MYYDPDRRNYGDAHLGTCKAILSGIFGCDPEQIAVADFQLDTQEATDLVVPGDIRISVRVRKPEQIENHFGQFTIRTSKGRDGSEWEKIRAGKVRYMIYGFGDGAGGLLYWWLIDLKVVVANSHTWECCNIPQQIKSGEAEFLAFNISGFPSFPPVVVASSEITTGNTDSLCKSCADRAMERYEKNTQQIPHQG